MQLADEALYAAKRGGRNGIRRGGLLRSQLLDRCVPPQRVTLEEVLDLVAIGA